MYGKKQWRGREVEGRYSDLMTYFVRELDTENEEIHDLIGEYPHFYFTIEYVTKMINPCIGASTREAYLCIIRRILDETYNAVTLEANAETLKKIPIDLFNRCHIIYRVQDDAMQYLKDTDTFSVDAGWYRVSQITKCNMMHINPDNYKFDEEL
jgi:hypothetical protein